MKLEYFSKNSDKLILFLNGWGSDAKQFATLDHKNDLLIVSDYRNSDFDFNFSKYQSIDLIAYSCGVMMANILAKKFPPLNKKIAINGTPLLFNQEQGLSNETLQAFYDINGYNYIEFRQKYLIANKQELVLFNKHQPNRTINDCIEELDKLVLEYFPKVNCNFKFDKVLLAEKDFVLPLEKQLKYWENTESEYKIIKGEAHFPFFIFKTFEELFDY